MYRSVCQSAYFRSTAHPSFLKFKVPLSIDCSASSLLLMYFYLARKSYLIANSRKDQWKNPLQIIVYLAPPDRPVNLLHLLLFYLLWSWNSHGTCYLQDRSVHFYRKICQILFPTFFSLFTLYLINYFSIFSLKPESGKMN